MVIAFFGPDQEWQSEQRRRAIAALDLVRHGGHATAVEAAHELTDTVGATFQEALELVREAWTEAIGACDYCGALAREAGSTVDAMEAVDFDEDGRELCRGTTLVCAGCRHKAQMMLTEAADMDDDTECPF